MKPLLIAGGNLASRIRLRHRPPAPDRGGYRTQRRVKRTESPGAPARPSRSSEAASDASLRLNPRSSLCRASSGKRPNGGSFQLCLANRRRRATQSWIDSFGGDPITPPTRTTAPLKASPDPRLATTCRQSDSAVFKHAVPSSADLCTHRLDRTCRRPRRR